ncbi:hypothetical protein COU91_02475 [Candidatus Saccharibacteria bacterium CG10_big_fil_rev_8_21_14_0_10_47_8]|nr:MAG: hypothetical protein COU91_02475 [Candidatus Saccharibacteria bacterium CG10_big_fil_rev_8_21_14_0_10_47_8]
MTKKHSALTQVLLALIPYSRQNLLLSFSPNKFFNELEKTSGCRTETLKAAYKRGEHRGLIDKKAKAPKLTKLGFRKVLPFVATRLSGQVTLMVIFDVPEKHSGKRQQLRRLLKDWEFRQVQKSVWSTNLDYRQELVEVISELELGGFVEIYESARLFPTS